MLLYDNPFSPFARKVRMVLDHKGLAYEAIDGLAPETGAQMVVVSAKPVEQRLEFAEVGKVADADRAAADLVLIGRPNAAPSGADLAGARGVLAQRVEVAVNRQDERAGLGDHQHFGVDPEALRPELLDLGLQRPGVEHYAVADD